jgi:3',5'-cyclic AMP phosphodiesterase CpdA
MLSSRRLAAAVVPVAAAAVAAGTSYAHPDTAGKSTLEQRIVGGDPAQAFQFLRLGPGEPYAVREELAKAQPGRDGRRRSLIYLGQITDFQLADEESPARVEQSFDPVVANAIGPGEGAWRPQEAMVAHMVEMSIRQMNRFLTSPVPQGNGERARMLNAVMTGDLADNQQRNETGWVVRLLEGGTLNPNSGSPDTGTYSAFCQALATGGQLDPNEAPKYTGVQDFDDYQESPHFWDPDGPLLGVHDTLGWPTYPGLMDRAQLPFTAEGLKVPTYSLFGNHDAQVQGNEDANAAYEDLVTGCLKPVGPTPDPLRLENVLDPALVQSLLTTNPDQVMVVPPDEQRQFVDKPQFRALHDTGKQADAHGFAYVDAEELEASNGNASYYSFSPKPGIRYITLDTNSQGGFFLAEPSPEQQTFVATDAGNLDHPQFLWLERELRKAQQRGELITVFGHHATGSLEFATPDEGGGVPPCTANDEHGHDVNPGCDRDPRSSSPIHLGEDLIELFHRFPNVIAYVAGHSHENRVAPFKREGGGGFWEIKSPAIADWPPQHRLIEVMDNEDGTLSIFGTMLDHDGPVRAPNSGTEASGFGLDEFASVGRTITYNDPQKGPHPPGGVAIPGEDPGPEGVPTDRNVELLLRDPRAAAGGGDGEDEDEPDGDGDRDRGRPGGGEPVAADTGELPFTGYSLIPPTVLGLLLLLGGLLARWRLSSSAASSTPRSRS